VERYGRVGGRVRFFLSGTEGGRPARRGSGGESGGEGGGRIPGREETKKWGEAPRRGVGQRG
jgi:hypothetical protein